MVSVGRRRGVTVLGDVGQVGDDLDGLPLVRRCSGCERHGWRVKTEKFLTLQQQWLDFWSGGNVARR